MRRKHKIILVSIFILLSIFYIKDKLTSKYPENPPKLKVEYNGQKYKTELNEYTWCNVTIPGNSIGNSNLSISEIEMADGMDSIDVKPHDMLHLKLSYDKNITSMEAFEVSEEGGERKTVPVKLHDCIVQAPSDKGEHVYCIDVMWDNTIQSSHSVRYVIKLNVV